MYQSKRKPGKSNADRTVGSEEEKVQKRLKTIDRPDASAEEEGEAQVGVTVLLMNFVFSVDIFCSFMFNHSGNELNIQCIKHAPTQNIYTKTKALPISFF